jgi:hypothetical protein
MWLLFVSILLFVIVIGLLVIAYLPASRASVDSKEVCQCGKGCPRCPCQRCGMPRAGCGCGVNREGGCPFC